MLIMLFVHVTPSTAKAQTVAEREAKIKAAYLYQFIKYVQFPDQAFAGSDTPLVIGTVGEDLVSDYMSLIAKKRDAGSRPLLHLAVTDASQAKQCHILFVSNQADPNLVGPVMQNAANSPVLLVGEQIGFIKTGGVITFTIAGNNVRLRLSMTNALKRGIKISSELAKIADVVN